MFSFGNRQHYLWMFLFSTIHDNSFSVTHDNNLMINGNIFYFKTIVIFLFEVYFF